MEEKNAVDNLGVEGLIYLLRGHKVILDRDLAALYQVDTRALVQAVVRNTERFPLDFCFQLSDQEVTALRSQIVISNIGRGGRRTSPYAFTEEGVAMLSGILRSPRAVQANIQIMRAFVRLRQLISSHEQLGKKLKELEDKYDSQFKIVFDAIREIMSPEVPPKKRQIGFKREG